MKKVQEVKRPIVKSCVSFSETNYEKLTRISKSSCISRSELINLLIRELPENATFTLRKG